jgi:SsrA-binding protein
VKPPRDKNADERKVLIRNKRARHEYHFDELLECGVALVGSEVKSLREGHATLVDAFAEVRGGELWLVGLDVSPYAFAHARNHEPRRARKLLAHKQEIAKLEMRTREKGYTLIPTEVYLKQGRVKVEIALARGKREYDKRETERRREQEREARRALAGDVD